MSLGTRGKLLLLLLTVHLAVGAVAAAVLWRQLRGDALRAIERDLARCAAVAGEALERAPIALTKDAADPIADRLGAALQVQVAIVDPLGFLVGDSDLPPAVLPQPDPDGRPVDGSTAARDRPFRDTPSLALRKGGMLATQSFLGAEGVAGSVRVALARPQVERMLEPQRAAMRRAALVGMLLAALVSAATAQWVTRAMRELHTHAGALARASGSSLPASASPHGLGALGGVFQHLAGEVDRKVTGLATELDRAAAVLEGVDDAVLALDARQRVTLANRAAARLLGSDAVQEGRSLVEVVRAPALQELVATVRAGGGNSAEFDLPGAPLRRILVRAAPLPVTGGSVLVLHDVSELRRLETVRRDFVANVSHELRTPVSVIRANAETLQAGAIDDPVRARGFVDALVRNAERLALLVDDLLDISRIEAGQLPLSLRAQPLLPALRDAAGTFGGAAAVKRLEFAIDCPDDLTVHADAKSLDQVLFNLVDNAVKYTPDGGHVVLAAIGQGQTVRVEVRDDGPGIAREHRERIFERFYRVEPGRSRDLGGTGLGLAIVKHLVAAMSGTVGVEPGIPRGSVFWFTLPAARQS